MDIHPKMEADRQSSQSPIEWNLTEKERAEPSNHIPHHPHHWEQSLHDAQDWFQRRKSSGRRQSRRASLVLQRTHTGKRWWKFTLRPWDDDEYQDWWFAGTAIPLLAATIGPLANVFSIAALVTYWRMCLIIDVDKEAAVQCVQHPGQVLGTNLTGQPYKDPNWCFNLNVVSLVLGFVGNFFLLCNFTGRIRYIIALPVTILMWYIATGILIGITVSMHTYQPPGPNQGYTEGFWYAIQAAAMYLICSMMLMVNMLGYFLGHYPQHFNLTDSQRTLILQTMLFFLWLAGGGAVFSTVETKYGHDPSMNWSFVNALYFCDVTILTVGFGDLYTTSDTGRGLLFPYSVLGIIMLGLMVSSISKFATELGSDNIIRKHVENTRARTVGRTVTSSQEWERKATFANGERPPISGPIGPANGPMGTAISFADGTNQASPPRINTLKKVASLVVRPPRQRKPKLILLREEKDRFMAMRHIQKNTSKFKRWYALCLSIIAFGLLWCVGAAVFWRCERKAQNMTYFKALYFCYVSLLTIGYGDLAPQTSAGRPFFVLWSLIAVPTMTILVSDLGETVINKFKHGTYKLADFTVLPKYGVWREFLKRHPWLLDWLQKRKQRRDARRRLEDGFQVGPEPEPPEPIPTIEELAREKSSMEQLARKLAKKIRTIADEMKSEPHKRYSYEEWVEITQLIRFTANNDQDQIVSQEDEEELIEWDWIGEDSPMMSRSGEPEFVLDRLCESMQRYIRYTTRPTPSASDDPDGSKDSPSVRRREPDQDGDRNDHVGYDEARRHSREQLGPTDTSGS